jgi:hypothetical protein
MYTVEHFLLFDHAFLDIGPCRILSNNLEGCVSVNSAS